MAEPHEHLEHAEHAEHAHSDPLNLRVALSMAIVAACLAGIGMLGHRSHNLVLQLQGDSNRLRTEASTAEVQMSNLFAWYQAKKLRQAQYDISASLAELSTGGDPEKQKKLSKDWKDKARSYDQHNDKKDNLPDLEEQGKEAGERAKRLNDKANEKRLEAEHVHHQADRLDIAHVLAEIALVLCSITLLTRKRAFWFIGLTAAVVAIGLTISAYMIPPETHPHHESTTLAP
jgi:hypothetical protein